MRENRSITDEATAQIRVLVVTADRQYGSEATERLQSRGDFSVDTASSVSDAVTAITGETAIDCIVSDHDLPETDGVAFLEAVRAQDPALPFIMFTNEGAETVASKAISAGVTEYLIKERHANQWEQLASLIVDAVRYYRNQAEWIADPDRARTLLDNSRDLIAVVHNGDCRYVNRTGLDLLGSNERASIVGDPITEWLETDDGSDIEDRVSLVQSGETVFDRFEGRVRSLDGQAVPVDVTATNVRWEDTPVVALVVRSRRKRTELERDVELITRAMAAAPIGVSIADATEPDNPLTYVNDEFLNLTGYDEAEVLGRNCRFLQGPATDEEPIAQMRSAIDRAEPVTVELRNYRKDGTEFWNRVSIAPVVDSEGTVTHYVGFQQDVTEQMETEQSLRQYKQSVESSKDLLAAVDTEFDYLFANNQYRQYHGLNTETVEQRSLPDVIGTEKFATIKADLERALNGRPVQTEVTRTHPERGERVLDVRLFPLEGTDGDIRGVGASMRDITADREREAAIERESEIRRLMSEVNHTLVRADDVEEMVADVGDIIGSSTLFSCTFVYLTDRRISESVCVRGTDLEPEAVEALHTEEYVESVFAESVLHMEDVTGPPFHHHPESTESHAGVGIPISYQGDRYGVLTVHFPPDTEPTPTDIDVLKTIGSDLGYYVFNERILSEYRYFTDIVERIDDPVMLQNLDGTFRVVNDAVTEFAGLSKAALVDMDETAFMDPDAAELVQQMKERVLDSETPVTYTVSPTFPDGRERTFSTTRYPYYDDLGQVSGTLAICRDVTELEEHQRQLRVLDRVLRHNINNNMNVIRGYAEMIADSGTGQQANHAGKIIDNSDILLDLAEKQRKITEFLSELPPAESIDLTGILEDTVDDARSAYPHADIDLESPPDVTAWANVTIADAIAELVANSVEHADADEPTVEIELTESEETVTVTIRDENEPIDRSERDVLTGVEELSALRHGSGLGLWLVKLIVDHSEGALEFAERKHGGNVVRIRLARGDGGGSPPTGGA